VIAARREPARVVDEFEATLATLRARYRNDPREELTRLLLLAIEREQLVSIAYRDELIQRRLARTSLDPEVQDVIRHAIAWAWKDEEMHAIYTRGVLLRAPRLRVRARAMSAQVAGAVAGWASSVQQHARWRHAPAARALAALTVAAGRLAGKVPGSVRDRLRFLSLQEFCELQVDAEETAALCWQRVADLAARLPELSDDVRAEFARMWHDENQHRRIFELLARSLGPDDLLRPGVTASAVADEARAVGDFFVPRAHRGPDVRDHPLGRGGVVHVVRGANAADKREVFRSLLDASGLASAMTEAARARGRGRGALAVAIKPSFMLGCHRDDTSVITDPVLVEELARSLRRHGATDVAVVEGRNVYDRFFAHRGVDEVARYFGFTSTDYRVVDLTEEQVPYTYPRGMAQHTVGRTWKDADFRIVFAKMRSHPTDLTHLAIGALQGVGPRLEEFLFAERQAHRDTAILTPLTDFPPDFALVDAYDAAADGLVGVIGCRNPRRPRRLYAGRDALAVDMVATRHMGVPDPRRSFLLRACCHWFGDPGAQIRVDGVDEPIEGWRGPYDTELSAFLSLVAYPVYQYASRRGAAFVPAMDTAAFPPLGRDPWLARTYRRLILRLLSLPA